jgi:ribonuclease P protein component
VTDASGALSPGAADSAERPDVRTLRKRPDFLAAARARRQPRPAFLLQARNRGADADAGGIRVGFTCSKKVGNSVARNRAKRRLREAARKVLPECGRDGWDYVLVGRKDATAARNFAALCTDLRDALTAIHAPPRPQKPRP